MAPTHNPRKPRTVTVTTTTTNLNIISPRHHYQEVKEAQRQRLTGMFFSLSLYFTNDIS